MHEYDPQNPFCVIGVKPGANCNRTWLPTTDAAVAHAQKLLAKYGNGTALEFYVVTPIIRVAPIQPQSVAVMMPHVSFVPERKSRKRRHG